MLSRVLLLVLPTKQNVRTSIKESNILTSMILPTFLLIASLMLTGLRAEVTAGGDSPGCVSCGLPALDKDAEERLMIEVAKQQILSKLHLKERPNITQTVPRVALLTALRKLQAGRVSNTIPTKDQGYEIVSFAETGERGSGYNASLGLTFQFLQEHGQNIQVLQSSLWVYARSSGQDPHIRAQVFLSGVPGDSNRTLLIEKMLDIQESNWHTFTITRPLQAFLDREQSHLHLEVSCREDGGENLCSLQGSSSSSSSSDNPHHQPFLVAKVRHRDDQSKHSLRKRSLRCGDDVTVCCKRDFYIKFKDIQWQDWIIAPEGYHMNYCMGQCPQHLSGSPGIASSFHATVFSQLKINGINTAVSSCCVPTERRPLSMMYFNSQHIIVKMDVPDMIVDSCGCT
ncbi:unnamed protein product [Lota lota]